jgi:hypothetical protein
MIPNQGTRILPSWTGAIIEWAETIFNQAGSVPSVS